MQTAFGKEERNISFAKANIKNVKKCRCQNNEREQKTERNSRTHQVDASSVLNEVKVI